jgi:hypothetical protein
MLSGRKSLLLLIVLPVVLTAGCQWLALTGVVGGAYVDSGPQATKNFTDLSNQDGAKHVEDAMRVWIDRGQLPMPVLPEGSHSFATRVEGAVQVKSARGARLVRLFDNNHVVADYVVAWDRRPEEYRLVSVTNRIYDSVISVDSVPTLQTFDLD